MKLLHGEAKMRSRRFRGDTLIEVVDDVGIIALVYGDSGIAKQGAEFIAEAFNVHAETGRTPRDLADTIAAVRLVIEDWNCWEYDPRGAAFALRDRILAAISGGEDAKP